MKSFSALTVIAAIAGLAGASSISGIDVSAYQPNINWNSVRGNGVSFAYIKATEGVSYVNPTFKSQWNGAVKNGIIRGAYHFAHPNSGPGDAQARYFVSQGGGWKNDSQTLPGALDIEYNPAKGGNACYGLSQASMVKWIHDFSHQYYSLAGRTPVIYTTTDWWKTCTGNTADFTDHDLWIAHHSSTVGPIPAGWTFALFWQYAEKGSNPGDQDYFAGTLDDLTTFASGNY
ncbi:glycoside hydrolase family 25 protein [Hygrophoropsis aurantiaca]|uniref:Glycoside hydrolase family 25 protein n=1 Tax=Hygrophoropsis aurantiaca TaxID=72124 RepID=A0ACB8AMG1_9AGAM|nr:glycoside hydrolase family 25 protein [Hygrophoropsis aurantiaca]